MKQSDQNEKYSFEDVLEKKGVLVYTNVGVSMMPLLRQKRDIIEIRAKEPGRCSKYDAVLYKIGKKYILHRILKVRPNDYVIAGDHCVTLEYGITDDMILGVMTRVIRDGREIRVTDLGYRFYVHLWCDFYPVRMFILRNKAKARSLVGALKRRMKRKQWF